MSSNVHALEKLDTLPAEEPRPSRAVVEAAVRTMIRWTGETTPERIRRLRGAAAAREIPVTLERAPWSIRHVVGHFGAYREGVGRLVDRLRLTYDPGLRLNVALEAQEQE